MKGLVNVNIILKVACEQKFKGDESISYAGVMVKKTRSLEFSLSEMGEPLGALVKEISWSDLWLKMITLAAMQGIIVQYFKGNR